MKPRKKRIKTFPAYYNQSAVIPEDKNDKSIRMEVKYCLFDQLFTLVTQTVESENTVIALN